MEEERKKTAKRIWEKIIHSVTFRIVTILCIILAGVFVVLYSVNRNRVIRTTREHFDEVGEMASELLAKMIMDEERQGMDFFDDEFLDMLQDFCTKYGINGIFLSESEEPYEYSYEYLYVSPGSKEIRTEETGKEPLEFEIKDEAKSVYAGKLPSLHLHYRYQDTLFSSYITGLYNQEGECYAVLGVNFLSQDTRSIAMQYVKETTIFIIIVVLITLLVIILSLHYLVLKPIQSISAKMKGFIYGDKAHPEKLKVKGKNELAQMATAYNEMTDDIVEYFNTLNSLSAAAEIQKGFLPTDHFENDIIKIDADIRPAKHIGGDFYDYYYLDDDRICFVIADVSGKGLSAAMLMANAINAIKYNARIYKSPADILYATNNDLITINPEQMFVTAFVAIYDSKKGALTYSNAGHNRPYLLHDQKTIELNEATGLLLGLFEEETYQNCEIKLHPNDLLFLFTDGLNEAVSKDKQFFGNQRICETLEENEPYDMLQKIKIKVDEFANGAEQHDDMTLMSILWKGEWHLQLEPKTEEIEKVKILFLENPWIPQVEKKKIILAMEELLTNSMNYAFREKNNGHIWIDIYIKSGKIDVMLTDDGTPYNPLKNVITKEEYDPDTQCGGLGKLIAFTIMQAAYQYQGEKNTLLLEKELYDDNHTD